MRKMKLFFVSFFFASSHESLKMNRQMRENQRRNATASKKWRSWKIFNSFQQSTIFLFRYEEKIDSRSESKYRIWSVNNCQNNWKSLALNMRRRKYPTNKSRSVISRSIASNRNQYLSFAKRFILRNEF